MRVRPNFFINTKQTTSSPKNHLPNAFPEATKVIATGIGIDIRSKGQQENVIKDNDPDNPLVAKKVLDALSLDLINFNQKERDTLANILEGRAHEVRAKREAQEFSEPAQMQTMI